MGSNMTYQHISIKDNSKRKNRRERGGREEKRQGRRTRAGEETMLNKSLLFLRKCTRT